MARFIRPALSKKETTPVGVSSLLYELFDALSALQREEAFFQMQAADRKNRVEVLRHRAAVKGLNQVIGIVNSAAYKVGLVEQGTGPLGLLEIGDNQSSSYGKLTELPPASPGSVRLQPIHIPPVTPKKKPPFSK